MWGRGGTWAQGPNVNKVIFYFNLQKRKSCERDANTIWANELWCASCPEWAWQAPQMCQKYVRGHRAYNEYMRVCALCVQLYLSTQKCTCIFIGNWLFKCLDHYKLINFTRYFELCNSIVCFFNCCCYYNCYKTTLWRVIYGFPILIVVCDIVFSFFDFIST